MSEKHKLPGGATRSEEAPAYHLIPVDGVRRIARRFGMGAKVHGAENWKRSLGTEANAAAFCREAYNHMIEHAFRMASGSCPDDDHLGAIGWAVAAIAFAEAKFGKRWTEMAP
jgi:hypothetical protein